VDGGLLLTVAFVFVDHHPVWVQVIECGIFDPLCPFFFNEINITFVQQSLITQNTKQDIQEALKHSAIKYCYFREESHVIFDIKDYCLFEIFLTLNALFDHNG
jgi:hypothetical protein